MDTGFIAGVGLAAAGMGTTMVARGLHKKAYQAYRAANKAITENLKDRKLGRKFVKERLTGVTAPDGKELEYTDSDKDAYYWNRGDKHIIVGDSNNPATLGHEYGHFTSNQRKVWEKLNSAGRTVYNKTVSMAILNKIISLTAAGAGLGAIGTVANIVLPTITLAGHGLVLAEEAIASKRGIEELKKLGASAEMINRYKKELKAAWTTYATSGLASAGIYALIQGLGGV